MGRHRRRTRLVVAPLLSALALGSALSTSPAAGTQPAAAATDSSLPLDGVVIALDPGHQLGNHNFPDKIHTQVPAGGFRKDCNTTGTSTNAGVPEATVAWQITLRVRHRLRALGATVRLTRKSNRQDRWGPCVNVRGRFPARIGAQLLVSVHADGAPSRDHGFHVIAPTKRSPWTTTTAAPSLRLARKLRWTLEHQGFARSSYIGGGTALSIRSDLATLNLSSVPVAMVEIGNMHNRGDARSMTRRRGQERYALGLVRGIRHFLGR